MKWGRRDVNNINTDSIKDFHLQIAEDGWIIGYKEGNIKLRENIFSMEAVQRFAEELRLKTGEEVDGVKAWSILKYLRDSWRPSLDEVRRLFPAIVGEDDNIKLAILSLLTLKLKKADERIMGVIIFGRNSSGKNHFSKNILEPLKDIVDEFTRVTGPFIERYFRDRNVDRRIILLQEAGDIPPQLHISLSEGKLRIGIAEKEGSSFKPVEIEARGQPFFWTTSFKEVLSQSIIERCIEIYMDESEEQTKKIVRFHAMLNSDYFLKESFEKFKNGCCIMFKTHVWDATPNECNVVIPYMNIIEGELEKYEIDVKFRRDFNKMMALIKGQAALEWRDRFKVDLNSREVIPRGEPKNIEEFLKKDVKPKLLIVAEWRDFYEVYKLMETSLKPTLTSLSDRDRKILEALKEIQDEPEESTYTTLHRKTGIPSSTIRLILIPKLEMFGYVTVDRDVKPHRITLVKDPVQYILDIERLKPLIDREVEAYIEKLKYTLQTLSQCSYSQPTSYSSYGNNLYLGFSSLEKPVALVAQPTTHDTQVLGGDSLDSGFSRDDEYKGVGECREVASSNGEYRSRSNLLIEDPVALEDKLYSFVKECGGEVGVFLAVDAMVGEENTRNLKLDDWLDLVNKIRECIKNSSRLTLTNGGKTVKIMRCE
jgi:hypothetical protein